MFRRESFVLLPLLLLAASAGCREEEKPTVLESSRSSPPAAKSPSAAPADSAEPAPPAAELPPGHPPIDAAPPMPEPVAPQAAKPPVIKPGALIAAGLEFTVPTDWTSEPPKSSMRLAQYKLPGKDGPAELMVFCFGPGQGGPVEANIQRWTGQFSNPDKAGEPVKGQTTHFEQDGLKVTTVRARGSYSGMIMAPAAGAAGQASLPNQALFGVIVEGVPAGSVFIKTTGPTATIEAHAAAIEKMAHSVKRAG